MIVKRSVCAITLSFFLAACGAAKGTVPTTSRLALLSMPFSLVVIGDSVSAGQYLPASSDAYPRILAADLHVRLVIYALPGHTTTQSRSMYVGELAPTYAVIELGTNDYNRSVPLATFAEAYESVVMSITPATRVVCLSLWDPINTADAIWSSPPGVPAPSNRLGASPAVYNAIIKQLCRGTYLSIQSIYDTPSYHGGGAPGPFYHPNVAGDEAIARLVYAVFASSQTSLSLDSKKGI